MESEYDDFCCYFQSTYCKRVEEWAFCYRVGTPFNTNMFVESFHRLLKIVYLDGKQNRRIDRLLNILLRIARDKAYERLIKIEKGKTTHRVCEINKRHQAAKTLLQKKKYELPTQEIDEHNITFWKVQGSDMKNEYTVVKLKNSCDCKIRCTPCNTCIHMFRCTCIDDLIHGTICKHIHIVQIVQDRNKGEKEMSLPENNDGILYGSDYFLEILGTEKQNAKQDNQKLIDVKEKMDKMIKQLQTMNQTCTNTDAITSSMVHVKAAIAIIKVLEERESGSNKTTVLNQRKRYAPNVNNEKQLRFRSTKKRRVITSRWAKPNQEEIEKCKENLMDISETQVCGICYKEDDYKHSQIVEWLQCENCSLWVHKHCTTALNVFKDDIYICQYCT